MKKLLRIKQGGQSTIELALILPMVALMVGFIIYVYKLHHASSEKTAQTYADYVSKFDHGNGLVWDPVKGAFVPAGEYSELIPPSALISPENVLKSVLPGLLANIGLNELFSRLKIFDTTTYAGGFAQGFTQSLATSTVNHLVQDGNLHDMSAADLENATWAGAVGALSSDQATKDMQGSSPLESSAQELFGSGLQAGLIGFASSHGDLKSAATSAVGGMLNSDTTKEWSTTGNDATQIAKGAGLGAVESSVSGLVNGNLNLKSVLVGSASGAIQTDAFARTLPLTGDDPKNSAMYGAFNGAFSSVVSGGDVKTTLVSAGMGAIGTKQTADAVGGGDSLAYMGVGAVAGAGAGLAQGQSLEAVGKGALVGAASAGVGRAVSWAGNEISTSLKSSLGSSKTSGEVTQNISNEQTANDLAQDSTFNDSVDDILGGVSSSMLNSETLKSLKPEEKEEEQPQNNGGSA